VSSRSDIFNQDAVDEEALKEEQEKMDMIMRRLMGGVEEEDQEGMVYLGCPSAALIMHF
jgi:hypothetical protein